jgi:hypothetical protein
MKYHWDDQIKENEMGGTCCTHGGDKKLGISWPREKISASQRGPCFMDLVMKIIYLLQMTSLAHIYVTSWTASNINLWNVRVHISRSKYMHWVFRQRNREANLCVMVRFGWTEDLPVFGPIPSSQKKNTHCEKVHTCKIWVINST